MGESKIRKSRDPHYGRIPKNPSIRGLVVSPPIEIDGSKLFAKSTNIDPIELRFSLLFWDKLVWPSSRAVHFGSGADEDFLIYEGVMERPDYTFDGDGAQGILKSQLQAYQDREANEPGRWALAQSESSLKIIEEQTPPARSLLVKLHRAIPVPSGDIPLTEVLEFKQRRLPELFRLREEIDNFYIKIDSADDKSFAFQKSFESIDLACRDLIKVNREWKFSKIMSDLDLSFGFSPLDPKGWAAHSAIIMGSSHLDLTSSVIQGLLASFTVSLGWSSIRARNKTNPFRYAALAHKELQF